MNLKEFSDDFVRRPTASIIAICSIVLICFLVKDNAFYVGCEIWNTLFHYKMVPDDYRAGIYEYIIALITTLILASMLIETIFKKIRFNKKLAQNKYVKNILLTLATIYAFYAIPSTINWFLLIGLLIISCI